MIWKNNVLIELRAGYIKALEKIYSSGESRQLIDTLIKFLFGISHIQLALQPDYRLSESEILKLHKAVKKLLKHVPLQYITGETQFLDLDIAVNESVLIPRPETEELVHLIISNEPSENIKLLDVGTGSGCIALALKKHLLKPEITAVDISDDALNLARINSKRNGLDVDFRVLDIFDKISHETLGIFDVIVSNPPYVTKSEQPLMQRNVLDYEPHQALFVEDEHPLTFYEAILEFSNSHLTPEGRIYFEINEKYGSEILRLFLKFNFEEGKLHQDIHGKNRFATALYKPRQI